MNEVVEEINGYKKRFSEMFENIPLCSVILDANWKIVFISNYLLKLTRWTQQEVIDLQWVDIFVPTERKEKTKNTQTLITFGMLTPEPQDSEIITKNGACLVIGWNYTLIRDNNGNLLGMSFVGEVRNINDQEDIITQPTTPSKLSVNKNVLANYSIIKILKGADHGGVQLAIHRHTSQEVAVKILRKELMANDERERARREIQILQQLTEIGNPFIVKLIEAEETATHFNLILEYINGGELMTFINEKKGLTEDHTQKIFKQILSAIECCHRNKIVHRDIKLQNIMLDSEQNVKVIDFGISNFVEKGTFRKTFCGTPLYAAPEIILGKEYQGPEVDIWSLGVVLYVMLTTEFPFASIGDIIKERKFKDPENVSKECLDLLSRMLTIKKEDRATLEVVLNHAWIVKLPIEKEHKPQADLPDSMTDNDNISKKRRISED